MRKIASSEYFVRNVIKLLKDVFCRSQHLQLYVRYNFICLQAVRDRMPRVTDYPCIAAFTSEASQSQSDRKPTYLFLTSLMRKEEKPYFIKFPKGNQLKIHLYFRNTVNINWVVQILKAITPNDGKLYLYTLAAH